MTSLNDKTAAVGERIAVVTEEVSTQEVLMHTGTVRLHAPLPACSSPSS